MARPMEPNPPPPPDDHTLLLPRERAPARTSTGPEPFLIQMSGGETGRMFRITEGRYRIGRSPECELFHNDPHISRIHAEITRDAAGRIVIRDLHSRNGVFVNGAPVAEQVLQNGDKILIGTELQFKFSLQDRLDQSYQDRLFHAANFDALTGVHSRSYFDEVLAREFGQSQRAGRPLSVMLMDVDHFKRINDQHGHPGGDAVLRSLGEILKGSLRPEDLAARYGGEEFAVMLRNTYATQLLPVAERLRQKIEAAVIEYTGATIRFTASIGLATLAGGNFATPEELLRAADANLYRAKAAGRNRVAQ
jgi:diguanylate cyclase (GGDEF)-like protein